MNPCKNDVIPIIIDHVNSCEKYYIPNITLITPNTYIKFCTPQKECHFQESK